jgi:hypothetical protein
MSTPLLCGWPALGAPRCWCACGGKAYLGLGWRGVGPELRERHAIFRKSVVLRANCSGLRASWSEETEMGLADGESADSVWRVDCIFFWDALAPFGCSPWLPYYSQNMPRCRWKQPQFLTGDSINLKSWAELFLRLNYTFLSAMPGCTKTDGVDCFFWDWR